MSDYSLNLPQTDFPMKANSAVREVEIQKRWDADDVYAKAMKKRESSEKFVLHDGPPYLSSSKIHIGTALNKVLKDIVCKYKNQKGFYSPYVPGYDSHGLPIENAALKDVKGGRHSITPVELRKRCREFALSNLKGQEANFRRLGVWGDWEHPYITLDQKFEAAQIRVFGQMATKGFLYKGLKSVSWCPTCETALAEAEVEYADHKSHSIYVKFEVASQSRAKLPKFVKDGDQVNFVIWTTTPWTLPANLGVALHPDFNYHFLKTKEHGVLVVSEGLKEAFLSTTGVGEVELMGEALGKELEFIETKHPFIDRTSLVVLGGHVTNETGTGVVHTAPGHGPEDFELGAKYKLGVVSPVDERGIFTEEAGQFKGQFYEKGNQPILDHLTELNKLIHHSTYSHSYPHCWRCKKPLIFRATEQWFASVDGFRKDALKAIDSVQWIPESGRNRIYNMVENRSDWCISRQRAWGVPIPVFYCEKCNKHLMTAESIENVATAFEKYGSDSWWEKSPKELIGDMKCECGHAEFRKESDIMDVWFDSGTTWHGVLDMRKEQLKGAPCELYLEGSDQHRGWFQSSLLTSVAVSGKAPYKTVLTHGFVVDETGRKMSKSMGNVVEPDEVIKQYGADVLRLWVASVNYTDDIPIGKNMLAQLAEVYRKLRNTARYLLGNLSDFNPKTDRVAYEKLSPIDQFILHRLSSLVKDVTEDFDRFEFFKYYQLLQNFCVVDLSSFYFDIAKDRLYTEAKNSESRRAVQTVLEEVLMTLVRIIAPVAPHLADDIWQHLPEALRKFEATEPSVLLTDFPVAQARFVDENLSQLFESLIDVRETVNKALEQARADKKIGKSTEAQVLIAIENAELRKKVESLGADLPGFFITSQATVQAEVNGKAPANRLSEVKENGLTVVVFNAEGTKCARCWKFKTEVGTLKENAELCSSCLAALKES
ncbi:MAG: isoleucine--tRNA ligase [Candidatus Obscuribacterales bacterium]|nr:isoleucine--tRNA ligase [Candidatus Obscuribacterales bacterium]